MDGSSIEHSDSDSCESWTLLENNSVYADEAPEFNEDQAKHEAQHLERDEDTDGISIISDSDHETLSPQVPDPTMCQKYNLHENIQFQKDIPENIPVTPHLDNITNNDDQTPVTSKEYLADPHAKHKTYVHRRNKRLSTVLNIIVLGSVITAAGVAIGHMWGAKYDCTMQTTSSVNKILSNLYKLQEENAYLRSKLKEFTFLNNNQIQQKKIQSRHNKCKRVFEESLSNNEPRKQLTKCVDENYNNIDNLMEHLVKPKFEKEFVADIDKLKTVYLQNKSWLDDEISRRLKIEEELLKKYNNEVNSPKEEKKDPVGLKNNAGIINSESSKEKEDLKEKSLDITVNSENQNTNKLQKKVTYADSLHSEHHPRLRRNEKSYDNDEDNEWLTSEHNINRFDNVKQDFSSSTQSNENRKVKSAHDSNHFITDFVGDYVESAQEDINNPKAPYTIDDDWTEVKPKFRRNEERYDSEYDTSVKEPKQKYNSNVYQKNNDYIKEKPNFSNEERHSFDDSSWSKNAQEAKNIGKKEKRKQNSHSWKNYSNEGRILANLVSEDVTKDDRYVVNKLKQEKKKIGYINSNKKQKRKYKHDKWNTKGEFGDRFQTVETSEDFVLQYPDKSHNHLNRVSLINNIDDIDTIAGDYKNYREKAEKISANMGKFDKKTDKPDQSATWFEKRAVFRTEARKKYYEQFGETSPNNSSWYFRRMRKREQCRAKGDNSTLRKIYKERLEKKNYKIKH